MGETKGEMCNLIISLYYVTESRGGYYKRGQMGGLASAGARAWRRQ